MILRQSFVRLAPLLGLVLALFSYGTASAENCIAKDGRAMAEIVLPEHPGSSVVLAAKGLQDQVKKMTGATLPITPRLVLKEQSDGRRNRSRPGRRNGHDQCPLGRARRRGAGAGSGSAR